MHTIETARLRLRPLTAADLENLYRQVYSDADVTLYLPGGEPRTWEATDQTLQTYMAHETDYGYGIKAVVDKNGGEFLGICGLYTLKDEGAVEIAYAFGKAHWGKGYATEAARAALRYGLETIGLEQLIALAVAENIASQRVMQKIGMRHEGITEHYYGTALVLYTQSQQNYEPGDDPYQIWDGEQR